MNARARGRAPLVVIAVGVRPHVELARAAGLALIGWGVIRIAGA